MQSLLLNTRPPGCSPLARLSTLADVGLLTPPSVECVHRVARLGARPRAVGPTKQQRVTRQRATNGREKDQAVIERLFFSLRGGRERLLWRVISEEEV